MCPSLPEMPLHRGPGRLLRMPKGGPGSHRSSHGSGPRRPVAAVRSGSRPQRRQLRWRPAPTRGYATYPPCWPYCTKAIGGGVLQAGLRPGRQGPHPPRLQLPPSGRNGRGILWTDFIRCGALARHQLPCKARRDLGGSRGCICWAGPSCTRSRGALAHEIPKANSTDVWDQ